VPLASPGAHAPSVNLQDKAPIPVGVLGASGYVGRELCALIASHPRLALHFAAANERRGDSVSIAGAAIRYVSAEDAPLGGAALVFSALPHGASETWVSRTRAEGAKVVDLSSDLRPGSPAGAGVPYGLTEVNRRPVRSADVVANPGCYPTAVLLALIPIAEAGLLGEGAISIVAASGVTGAGSSPRPELLFAEVAESYRPYGVGNTHRHLGEMTAVLSLHGADSDVIFTPHLLPVTRGIVATMTVPLRRPLDGDPLALWRKRYSGERFIELNSDAPSIRDVVHRNVARISVHPAAHVRRPAVVIVSAIDNLVKGAAGQAIQNENLMLGLDETLGLPA